MAKHYWKIKLEITVDEEVDGDMPVITIEKDGSHDTEGSRPVNESLALELSYMMKMLHASGSLVGETEMTDTVNAFSWGLD